MPKPDLLLFSVFCYVKVSSDLRYSPTEAWWKHMISVGLFSDNFVLNVAWHQSLALLLYQFHNSLPPPHGLIFKGRPSNHKISWVRISIFLFLKSQVINSLHPNIIIHILHTVFSKFPKF